MERSFVIQFLSLIISREAVAGLDNSAKTSLISVEGIKSVNAFCFDLGIKYRVLGFIVSTGQVRSTYPHVIQLFL